MSEFQIRTKAISDTGTAVSGACTTGLYCLLADRAGTVTVPRQGQRTTLNPDGLRGVLNT